MNNTQDEFFKLKRGIPNNIRCHIPRKESIVKVRFNAKNFYPWNNDSDEYFNLCRNLFTLRAKIVGKDFTEFFNNLNSKYTARIALQYYPLDIGFFSSHRDP